MAKQVPRVDTLFLHGIDRGYLVAALRDGDHLFRAVLEVTETEAGPRPARFLQKVGSTEEPRRPDEFVELARRAARIRISEQTPRPARDRLQELLEGYQLQARVVRTCRYCASKGRYSPITEDTAISAGRDEICPDCAIAQLEGELSYQGGLTSEAVDRLEDLLLEVRDLDRIVNLLSGDLDPELTKFDEIGATVDAVDPVTVADLDLHPTLSALVGDRFETLLPVQSLAVHEGLLEGADQLVVSATATGKTLVGELAGLDRVLRGEGKLLFLVPLVALANQKYDDFRSEYGDLVDVTLRVGASRIRGDGVQFDAGADVIVGTYEGIDHALRTGRNLGDIGTVVIDEVHTLTSEDRGHRLDGLITRLHHYCEQRAADRDGPDTQWIYLSATVGNPTALATHLGATLIEFEERPVPIERHVTFADDLEKIDIANRLVTREFDRESSKGYRGQTIIFTNSRRRCHEISRRIEYPSAPYHAGLDYGQRTTVEGQFADGDLAAVVTTAALAAGVDFPASQVIFDALAMGIEWLTVQEFHQMLGRAGRPDYHDRGVVWLLVEPGGVYHGAMDRTEDEVAFSLLKEALEDVVASWTADATVEEALANIVVAGSDAKTLNDRMLADIDTRWAVAKLLEYGYIDGLEPTPRGRAVARHFLSPTESSVIIDAITRGDDPYDIVAAVERLEDEF
ncbi:MAG: DEAD/DEAH box helicase [Halobacteriales archaeon]|nr:DEAD/DEAH box helicase [Halobacteriales archaeon]